MEREDRPLNAAGIASRAHCRELDCADPLARRRGAFVLDEGRIYLDGNSLGPLTPATRRRVQEVLDLEWGRDLIAGWNAHGWIDLPARLGARIAPLVGAAPADVLVAESTSVNLFKLAASYLREAAPRTRVVTELGNFPTDLYVLEGLADLMPGRVELVAVPRDEILAAVDGRTALVVLTHVRYKSAEMFDLAAVTLRWHFVQSGKLDQSTLLSVRYIWMAAKDTDEFTTRPTSFIESDGTSLKAALDIARKYGVVTDSELPFVNGQLYGGKASAFYSMAATRRIASYYALRRPLIPIPASMIVSAFRLWLATKGPILVRLVVDRTFNGLTNDTNGKLDTYKPYPPGVSGGHAVAIVGYTPTNFIVRNSWGTDWGDQGFGYASHKYTVAAFAEAYGVIL